ncbi:MAG: phosphatase PAP2 family protein [Anaerolineales bacterium]|jgi:undecaprenyl-diphosphatase
MNKQFWNDLDRTWYQRLTIHEDDGLKRLLAILLAHSGDSWFWLLGIALVWFVGDASWKTWALRMASAVFILAVTVLLLKFSFRRARPEGTWGNVYRKSDPHSFPSGHAARATLLVVLTLGLGPLWLAAILILWAPLVSAARVGMGLHYPTDVLAGSVIGLAVGIIALIAFL